MDVLLLIRELAYGGADRQLVQLAIGLARRVASVRLAVFYRTESPLERQLAEARVPLVDLAKGGPRDVVRFSFRLGRLLAQRPPSVIYSFLPLGNLAALVGRVAARRTAIVWGVRCSAFDNPRLPPREHAVLALEARLSWLPDLVITNSRRAADDARARGFPQLIVIPNGIDVDRFRAQPQRAAAFRRELGIGEGVPLVGKVAKLNDMKDYLTFTRAAALLRRRRPDVQFAWVGPDKPGARAELERLHRELGMGELVRWLPPRDDVEVAHSAFDVATLSSAYGEGFPNVVAEAMACGTPCVVTDVGDAAEVVGDTGMVVPPRDPERLAEAWERMLARDGREREGLGERARARIVERFSVDAMVERTLVELRAVAESR